MRYAPIASILLFLVAASAFALSSGTIYVKRSILGCTVLNGNTYGMTQSGTNCNANILLTNCFPSPPQRCKCSGEVVSGGNGENCTEDISTGTWE